MNLGDFIEEEAPSDDALLNISQLVQRQVGLEDKIGLAREALSSLERDLKKISEVDIPSAMREAGTRKFTTDNGLEVEISDKMSASVSKANKPLVVAWLRAHDFGSLVKNLVFAEFGRNEDEAASNAFELLRSAGIAPQQTEDVNTTTLKAFAKEQMEAGNDIPIELFGIHIYTTTIIKRKI